MRKSVSLLIAPVVRHVLVPACEHDRLKNDAEDLIDVPERELHNRTGLVIVDSVCDCDLQGYAETGVRQILHRLLFHPEQI